jgi:hypothetical protein
VISVIVPTVTGRAESLARCLDAYRKFTPTPHELIVVKDRPTCGLAWQEGLERATGDYLHLTADDLEPHRWWSWWAIRTVKAGWLPCPVVKEPDGRTQSTHGISCSQGISAAPVEPLSPVGFTTVPFCSREQWDQIGPMIDLHYCTDAWVSHRGRLAGIETVAEPGYRFTHHNEPAGRGAGMGDQHVRTIHDRDRFEELAA